MITYKLIKIEKTYHPTIIKISAPYSKKKKIYTNNEFININ